MKKNEKSIASVLPFETHKDTYHVRTVSILAFLCVCIVALSFVVQIYMYKRSVSERMLCETALQKAGVFEEVLQNAKESLKDIADQTANGKNITEAAKNVNNGLFKTVTARNIRDDFEDEARDSRTGLLFDEEQPRLYLATDGRMITAELDFAYLKELAEISGSYGNVAEHILFDLASGKILVNSGEKYGFEGSGIGFLKEFDFEASDGAKSMFSQISRNGTGYSIIKNADGERFSFAYAPVGSDGLFLMQFLPENHLHEMMMQGTFPLFAGIFLIVLGSLAFTLWICRVSKNAYADKSADSYNTKVLKILLMQVAEGSFASMFVYYRDTDEITVFRDRDGIHPNGHTKSDAVSYLGKYYGHDESNIRRLKNAIALAGPQKSIKLELTGGKDRENTIIEYTLCGVKDETENRKDAVVCTVLERTAFDEARDDIGADGKYSDDSICNTTGIEVMLERNSWRFLWNNEECFKALNYGTSVRGSYDADIEKEISPFIMSSDRQKFLTTVSRLNLLENYRNGTTDMCIKYRINTGDGIYELRVLDIHMYRDAKNDEIKANMYARHLGRV